MRPVKLAILGATGMVGQTTLTVLEEWGVPLTTLDLYASASSAGRFMKFHGKEIPVQELTNPIDAEYAVLALSAELSKEIAPALANRGIHVIDHSSAHRMDSQVPLVIPEINGETLRNGAKLVANPNCSASIILMALAPIERAIGIKRVILSTYQSVSGAGAAACEELKLQKTDDDCPPKLFPHRIAGNVIPEIGALDTSGYTGEETKISLEIRKILNRPDLHVTATSVRVPVEVGHAASVSIELKQRTDIETITGHLRSFAGLNCDGENYSTPLEIAGKQDVHVGRVRLDPQNSLWLHFWVVGDNLRKGAASNAVQILKYWATL